ncbi:hypothetical protein V8E55_007312 [Tylopilus felleus]|jgi:hypothetical protein
MIITPDDQPSKLSSDQKVPTKESQVGPDEPPPSYSAQTEPGDSSSGPSSPPTFKTKPTNFLLLSTRDTALRGEFVIDSSISIPSSLLPPLGDNQSEDDRKNLSLASKHSSVNAEIWLLPGSPVPSESATDTLKPRRTTIALASDHGSIRAQLRTLDGAAPFSLTGRCGDGTVRLALPRSFQGLISLSTGDGSITLSDALTQNVTQLSQIDTARRYFVGDFKALGEDAWGGDQVEIEAPHGSIRLKYVNEVAEAHGKKGFLSRLFGV